MFVTIKRTELVIMMRFRVVPPLGGHVHTCIHTSIPAGAAFFSAHTQMIVSLCVCECRAFGGEKVVRAKFNTESTNTHTHTCRHISHTYGANTTVELMNDSTAFLERHVITNRILKIRACVRACVRVCALVAQSAHAVIIKHMRARVHHTE